jgi:glycosyltransferase involved in cell wall biosynthesis
MIKKRILFCGEASFLSTGFATYYRELLQKLSATGKYEIAELGSYARQDDPRVESFIGGRWKFYGVLPMTQEEHQVFNQPSPNPNNPQNTNQFGEWKLSHVLADFQPDIVIDIRDWWMLEHQERNPFRDWFKWLIMPTVDAEPQQEEWINTYEHADMVLTYSDYGIHALKRQSPKMKIFPKPMRPGVDLETFKPMDRDELRDYFNLGKDIPIIGTVMRNQSRKLYPDLIDAFACMKKKYKGQKSVDDAVLMIHSAWPDNQFSYDYPRHVMRLQSYDWLPYANKGIQSDVLQTYMCHACGEKFVGWAMTLYGRPREGNMIKVPCSHCGKTEATPPTTGTGYSREELAKLYNLMDLYVQCSICEGDGMPIQEAKACGVPALVVDYTAMREKGKFPDYSHFEKAGITEENYTCNKGGESIDVDRYYYEPETSCRSALPDIEDMADKMAAILMDKERKANMSREARECVEENYDWEKLWKQWEFVLDNVKPKDRATTWDSPIEIPDQIKPESIPDNLDDDQFIEWLYINILKYKVVDPQGAKMWQEHLNQGVTRAKLLERFIQIGNQQMDTNNIRQKIRAEVAGQSLPQQQESMDWV